MAIEALIEMREVDIGKFKSIDSSHLIEDAAIYTNDSETCLFHWEEIELSNLKEILYRLGQKATKYRCHYIDHEKRDFGTMSINGAPLPASNWKIQEKISFQFDNRSVLDVTLNLTDIQQTADALDVTLSKREAKHVMDMALPELQQAIWGIIPQYISNAIKSEKDTIMESE